MAVDALTAQLETAKLGEDETVVMVDDVKDCKTRLTALIEKEEPVAVDFEGVDLCRTGALCLVQLAPRQGAVLLIDVETLGEAAFGEGRLRELLESPRVLKIGYDGRGDSDALWHLHNTRLQNLWDVQVAYCTKRDKDSGRRDRFVKGLGAAMQDCPGIPAPERRRLDALKMAGKDLFAPERGGSYDVWRARPMPPELIEYCALDVRYLHAMRDAWGSYVPHDRMMSVVQTRLAKTTGGSAPAKGRHMSIKDWAKNW
jgi:exonuclease 3'-5' domain-containing protein 1